MTKSVLLFLLLFSVSVISSCNGAQTALIEHDNPEGGQDSPLLVRVAFPSVMDIDDVAVLLAMESLQEEGLDFVPTFFAQSELATAATAEGDADIGFGGTANWLSAVNKGAPVKSVMKPVANDWSVLTVPDIRSCEDLNGRRTAIHSEGSVSAAMLRAYIEENCPGTEPQYLVIPGSENRAAALIAGEIDATPVELIDSVRINSLRPGEFTRLIDFSEEIPWLITSGVWVNDQFASAHPQELEAFTRSILETNRRIVDDPAWFSEQVQLRLEMEEEDTALMEQIVAALLDADHFPVNGSQSVEDIESTIRFFEGTGRVEEGVNPSTAFDSEPLEKVLNEIGRR